MLLSLILFLISSAIYYTYFYFFFFFNDTATTEIYTLSLHDALPISQRGALSYREKGIFGGTYDILATAFGEEDRKSTRLNSSHRTISYAVFCLKKKKKKKKHKILSYILKHNGTMIRHNTTHECTCEL